MLINVAASVFAIGVATTAFAGHVGPGPTGGVDVNAIHDNNNIYDANTTPTPGFDAFNDSQNETSVAISPVDPHIVAIGANDARMAGLTYQLWVGLYVSADGGATWFNTFPPGFFTDTTSEGLASPVRSIPWAYASDPVVRFDADGNLYLLAIVYQAGGAPIEHPARDNAVFVAKYRYTPGTPGGTSTVNGAADPPNFTYELTTLVEVGSVTAGPDATGFDLHGQFEDKPWFEIDRNRSGRCFGNVYVAHAAQQTPEGSNLIVFSRSEDGGATFSPSKPITVAGRDGSIVTSGAAVAVDRAGTVYVAYRASALVAADPVSSIRVVHSEDCGRTFSKPVTAAVQRSVSIGSPLRASVLPAIAVDDLTAGLVYVAYRSGSGTPLNSNIFVARSTDGGNTWGTPAQVNDDSASKAQFFPTIAVSNGAVHVAWYDFRDSPPGSNLAHVYYASSNTSGVTYPQFSHNVRVTDIGFNPDCNVLGPTGAFLGDYIELAARFDGSKHIVHVAWADNRDVDPCVPLGSPFPFSIAFEGPLNSNIYTDRLVVDP
jgi:hypothetical protein